MYLEIILADFAVFRGNTWISRVRDRAKYQKPWLVKEGMVQPCKLKFLLSFHLATYSVGLGRLFYKPSCQLQNLRCHGDQNGRNLEGCMVA